MTGPLPEFWVSKSRLETLLDGVFAIAMTLMVLDLKVPDLRDRRSMPELLVQVGHTRAALFGFLLSVLVLGVFWYKHHRQYHLVHRVDRGLLAINLAFLAGVAFFPFAAGLMGRFPGNTGVFFIYMPSIGFLTLCLAAQWGYARHKSLLDPDLPPETATLLHVKNLAIAAGVCGVSTLYIGAAVWAEHADAGRDLVGLVPILLVPFAVGLKRWSRRRGV